jgi:hypothetical protein
MARPLTTTEAGLGWEHQQARKLALAMLRDGIDCCPRCGRPMFRRQTLHLDDFPSRAIARRFGITPVKRLSHAKCNMSAGGRLGRAMQLRGMVRGPKPGRRKTSKRRPW